MNLNHNHNDDEEYVSDSESEPEDENLHPILYPNDSDMRTLSPPTLFVFCYLITFFSF